MALNPVAYTEKVVSSFLRYQLTAYPFADPNLYAQMRALLSLDVTRNTPLFKGPYVSLSRAFRSGSSFAALEAEGIAHPHLKNMHPYPTLYGHQEKGYRSIVAGNPTLVSTGTGSGKTETFLYPIIDRCLRLRDENASAGIVAVVVYPMNALAEDQLGRLRDLLAGTGITFGMYVGKTPEKKSDVTKLPAGSSQADYRAELERKRREKQGATVHPPEERCSREEMRTPGQQPRILLTNVKQLELLLTRQADVELFDGARLDFLVFDEAHTFGGAVGAETACLIRRLRAYCGKTANETVCVATSATIASEEAPDAPRDFAARFFGVDASRVNVVTEEYEPDVWAPHRIIPGPLQNLTPSAPRYGLTAESLSDYMASQGTRACSYPARAAFTEAGTRSLSGTEGANEDGSTLNTSAESIREGLLAEVLRAVEAEDGQPVVDVYKRMTGRLLPVANWREALHQELSANEVVFQLADILTRPKPLEDLIQAVGGRVGRRVPEEEVLIWLTLGAAARKEERPLLRPVAHGFVRGVGGAVVTFSTTGDPVRLYLSAKDAEKEKGKEQIVHLAILACSTCGQHYFEHHVKDFTFLTTDKKPGGGDAYGKGVVWEPLDSTNHGTRVVLLDHLISETDTEDAEADTADPPRTAPVYLCRNCGALHDTNFTTCAKCGRDEPSVRLLATATKEDETSSALKGKLSRCLSCGANARVIGGAMREPIRAARATAVADVHVLAQDMVRHAERERLLVFADNRQDAAFQAGWMHDHARRFRLRALMMDHIQTATAIGDLVIRLDEQLEADDELSQALIPEVWDVARKPGAPVIHRQQRRLFLRIKVLLEAAMTIKQRQGLEPLGRIRFDYIGLEANSEFITRWANALSFEPDVLLQGVAGLLDRIRRNYFLYDREGNLFTKYWNDGDLEILRGYFSKLTGVPKGQKLVKDSGSGERLQHWISSSDTSVRQIARRWGVQDKDMERFLRELWAWLVEARILVPVTLLGARGNPMPQCSGAHQIDADVLRMVPHTGLWRCRKCRRAQPRPAPMDRCLSWRCDGTLVFEPESTDSYDLQMLDVNDRMIRPREHSAQVPEAERERLENLFKGDSDAVNTLVATPTLELGVDIGALDSVLMRNAPPLPANYWQRAGRAGRRHRMAVVLTYARSSSHDQAYFNEPLRMLEGRVEPPRFNLRNEQMIEKHVHAAVITRLRQLARPFSPLSETDRQEIQSVLNEVLPRQIKNYLFDTEGNLLPSLFSVASLQPLIEKHKADLLRSVTVIFTQGWPGVDSDVVTESRLTTYIDNMTTKLQAVVKTLRSRLNWALDQRHRLEEISRQKGTLDPENEALRQRCDRLIKRYKGELGRTRQEAAGHDDTNTYNVLAAESFLPGYGLEVGQITATANLFGRSSGRDFDLPRVAAMAVREYVPGNMIYANGHRFVPRFFHLEVADTHRAFHVDPPSQSIREAGAPNGSGSLGGTTLTAVEICNLDLAHISHINDEEANRFQLPVAVYGHEQDRHNGGKAYRWGDRDLLHRRGVHLRLVNVGATSRVAENRYGYPVCLVCGHSRSPFSSREEQKHFADDHQARCGRAVENVGFFANIVADAISLPHCASREEAYSLIETLRMGASQILEMEREDLDVLLIGHPGRDTFDILLYDPMPGGSGLLDQIIARFPDVVEQALTIARSCPSECARACIDCLHTFRNAFFHAHLDRNVAVEKLDQWGGELVFTHDIPAKQPAISQPDALPVNAAEALLGRMLERAGFPTPMRQHQIPLGHPLISTIPDCFWPGEDEEDPGVCIYLDGLSNHIHGNSASRSRDTAIRAELRSRNYEVIEIAATELSDLSAMQRRFYKLGSCLLGKDRARQIKDNSDWFSSNTDESD